MGVRISPWVPSINMKGKTMLELFLIAAKIAVLTGLGIASLALMYLPIAAIKHTASKTANYDESKNKPGHCW